MDYGGGPLPRPRVVVNSKHKDFSAAYFSPAGTNRMRTRNDDEFYVLRRSASSARKSSGNNNSSSNHGYISNNSAQQQQLCPMHQQQQRQQHQQQRHQQQQQQNIPGRVERVVDTSRNKPGYLQETFSSVRKSRERANASPTPVSRTPSQRRRMAAAATTSNNNNNNTLFKYENEINFINRSRPKPRHYQSFNRNGSFSHHHSHTPRPGYPGTTGAGGGSTPQTNFLRTFSFRHKPLFEGDLFSSMPCLNNATGLSAVTAEINLDDEDDDDDNNVVVASSMTPTSSSLVLNSLAYQVLPEHNSRPSQQHHAYHQHHHHHKLEPHQHHHHHHHPRLIGNGGGSNSNNLVKNVHTSLSSKSLSSGSGGSNSSSSYNASNATPGTTTTATTTTNPSSVSSSINASPSPGIRKRPVADDAEGHLAYLPGDVLASQIYNEIFRNLIMVDSVTE